MLPNWVPLVALLGSAVAAYGGRWLETILAAIVVGVGLFAYAYFRGGVARDKLDGAQAPSAPTAEDNER